MLCVSAALAPYAAKDTNVEDLAIAIADLHTPDANSTSGRNGLRFQPNILLALNAAPDSVFYDAVSNAFDHVMANSSARESHGLLPQVRIREIADVATPMAAEMVVQQGLREKRSEAAAGADVLSESGGVLAILGGQHNSSPAPSSRSEGSDAAMAAKALLITVGEAWISSIRRRAGEQ